MIGNRRGSISESYAAVIAIAFGLMAIALGIYVGYELNSYASIHLVRSNIWGAIIAYEEGGRTVIIVENIGRQAFFVNKSFIDGKAVPATEGERGYLGRGEYNGPGLGPDQYEELYASAAGTIAQAQLCATSYPKACVVIWTYINYTVRNRSQAGPTGSSAGPNEAGVVIEDPYGAQWSLTWTGGASGSMSGNSSRTVAITLPTSASSITASLSTEKPYYSVPANQAIGAGQSGTFIIDYNATGTAIIDDVVDAAWSLAWTGYSDGSYSSTGSAVVPIEAGTGVAISLMASYNGGSCSSIPSSGELEAGGVILFQVNCTNAPHYYIYFNATSPPRSYTISSLFTVLKPMIIDSWLNHAIPLRSGWNSGELARGETGVEAQVGTLYLESTVPAQDVASWALPNLTYVVDWNGTIYGEAGRWGESQRVGGGLYVTSVTFQSPTLPTTNVSRGEYLLVLLGWLDVNGKPIVKPSASGWPYQAIITAWFGSGTVGEPITASSSIASRTWTGQYVNAPYPEAIPLRGEVDDVTLTVPQGYQVYWSNAEEEIGLPIQNPIPVENGSTIYVYVGRPNTGGGGGGRGGGDYVLYFTVSDTAGAEWVVSSPVQSISGNTTTITSQTLKLGSLPATVTAGITSSPLGGKCSITPSTVAVNQNYESLSFTVNCTNSPSGGGGGGGGGRGGGNPPPSVGGCFFNVSAGVNPSGAGMASGFPSGVFVKSGGDAGWSVSTTPNGKWGFTGWSFSVNIGSISGYTAGFSQTGGSFSCPSGLTQNVTATLTATANYVQNYFKISGPQTITNSGTYDYTISWQVMPQTAEWLSWSVEAGNEAGTGKITAELSTSGAIDTATLNNIQGVCQSGNPVLTLSGGGQSQVSGGSGSYTIQINATLTCRPESTK